MPPRKKLRAQDVQPSASTENPRASLTSLPIEILAEILLLTRSPPTVVAVSRTCSFLYRTLALNPAASFIWRGVRESCAPHALPEPGDLWKSEADYAAFVFGGGVCEVCKKHTRAMYTSFAIRLRLCGAWHCRRKVVANGCLADATNTFPGKKHESVWVPYVESELCFRPVGLHVPSWPQMTSIMLRKTDLDQFLLDLKTFNEAEQAQADRGDNGGPVAPSEEDERKERVMKRCNTAAQRFPEIMQFSVKLTKWKSDYERNYRKFKQTNRAWTKDLAKREGWDFKDLVGSQTYGSILHRSNFLLEMIRWKNDVCPIKSEIESELLAIKARRKRQEAESTYKEKLTEVKKIYERMRCGTLQTQDAGASSSTSSVILPPLSVFLTLPSVRALKGSPDPSAIPPQNVSTPSEIKSSPLALSLIQSDVHNWLVPVKKHLMSLLGYPDGWQSADSRRLHPLDRLTARFYCKKCGEGKVGKSYRRERCLDLKGVCSHVCVGKGIEGPSEEAQQEEDAADEDGRGKSKGKAVKNPDWKVELFDKDKKAIRLIRTVFRLRACSEEKPLTDTSLKEHRPIIRCMSCKGWINMDLETAIGHAHRHESMETHVLIHTWLVMISAKNPSGTRESRRLRAAWLAFERGTTELLLGPSRRAKDLCNKHNYGCRHCVTVEGPDGGHWTVSISANKVGGRAAKEKGMKAMTFHGLRSHVKEKHGIQDIGDEDFFCYTSIRDPDDRRRPTVASPVEVREGGHVWFRQVTEGA